MKWIRSKKRFPSHDTRYASDEGVTVIALAEKPFTCFFSFMDKAFYEIVYGVRGAQKKVVKVKYWMPLPDNERISEKKKIHATDGS